MQFGRHVSIDRLFIHGETLARKTYATALTLVILVVIMCYPLGCSAKS